MRCLLKVSIPVETGNATIGDGTLPKTIESILNELKPEAAYFAEENGKRTGFIFFDLKDTSQIPAVVPCFQCASRIPSGHEPGRFEKSNTGDRESSQELLFGRTRQGSISESLQGMKCPSQGHFSFGHPAEICRKATSWHTHTVPVPGSSKRPDLPKNSAKIKSDCATRSSGTYIIIGHKAL